MEITRDAIDLADAQPGTFQSWTPPAPPEKPAPLHRPAAIRKREQARQRTLEKRPVENPPDPATTRVGSELAVVRDLESYSNCPVPLHAVINRERYADGHTDQWVLLDTKRIADPAQTRTEYALRTVVEERYRQTKCFSGLAEFSSRAFSLVVNQVVFVLLTYSLMQWYLRRIERRNMNRKTRPRILDVLQPTFTVILIYYQNYVAFLSPLEHQEMVLTLSETARKKIRVFRRICG